MDIFRRLALDFLSYHNVIMLCQVIHLPRPRTWLNERHMLVYLFSSF